TVPADGSAQARQLTSGLANNFTPAWSPDGKAIVFSRSRTGPRDAHRTDLWRMNADGSDARQLTDGLAVVSAPAWSPDGSKIAFQGSEREGDARMGLWVIDAEGGAPRRLGGDDFEIASYPLDNSSPPYWTSDSSALFVLQGHQSTSRIVRITLADEAVTPIVDDDRQVTMLSVAPAADRLIFAASDTLRFCELFTVTLAGGEPRRLAAPNAAWAAGRLEYEVEHRTFRSSDGEGEGRDGWLLMPRGDGGPRPLWVDFHGGPHTFVSLGYPYHPYWHVLLSQGWAVLALNTLGSASYGASFAERLRGSWGESDLPEHLAAIDQLVEEGVVDPKRIAIGGKSYGGYLSAWAIGQTQRFCAAVVSAPVADMVSHFGTSDSGYYVTPFAMDGEVHEKRETYDRLSPVRWLDNVTTPTLLLQGEEDQRCPVGQSEEIFATLMRLGKAPVEFVRYPGGDHHLAEQGTPSHRVDYTRRIVGWAQRWSSQ
ncbi:MAG TPA: prolyl oligopeptidase family serine peptidase, partial [Nannocystis sp.]